MFVNSFQPHTVLMTVFTPDLEFRRSCLYEILYMLRHAPLLCNILYQQLVLMHLL